MAKKYILLYIYIYIYIISFLGKQFQTFNVHQLLHFSEVVEDLGPLWSNSCFPFEDYNGDLRDLFHGTQNVDGQVSIYTVCMLQRAVQWHSLQKSRKPV